MEKLQILFPELQLAQLRHAAKVMDRPRERAGARRTFGWVLALTLRANGVTRFYTRNVRDHRGCRFCGGSGSGSCRVDEAVTRATISTWPLTSE